MSPVIKSERYGPSFILRPGCNSVPGRRRILGKNGKGRGPGDPPYTEEIFTALELDTTAVVIVKVALALPLVTVTLAGTVAADVLLLASDTTAPPVGAGPFSVTVPLEVFPPTMAEGLRESDESEDGFTVRLEVLVTPAYTAETFTAVELETDTVVTGNVALAAPLANVTFAGTLTNDGLLLESVTSAPPTGAGPLIVTVPVEPFPPITLDGFRERDDSEGIFTGRTVRLADRVTPPYKPEIRHGRGTGHRTRRHRERGAGGAAGYRHARWNGGRQTCCRSTTTPPLHRRAPGPLSVTVPVEGLPPPRWTGSPSVK